MSTNKPNSYSHQTKLILLLVMSILIVSFAVYSKILTYFFTATDTLTLIDTSRIQSSGDLLKIFSSPLMVGTSFAAGRAFYRPITSLTYSLDYALWRLNPFGYHLTDLLLHMLVCVLVFFTLLHLTHGRKAIAWMSAIVFAIHPILVENIPAISRRQDTLSAFFILISLLLFLRAQKRQSNGFLILSVIGFCLALGSKETAILFPGLLLVYVFISTIAIQGDDNSFIFSVVLSIKKCLPYIFVAVVYTIWRGFVLGGIGGYANRDVNAGTISFFIDTTRNFFSSLVFPAALPYPLSRLMIAGWGLLSIGLLGILCFLNRKTLAPLSFNSKPRAALLQLLSGSAILQSVLLFLVWILLSLLISLATSTFQFWYMYIPAIPFSALVSIALIEPLQYAKRNIKSSSSRYAAAWTSFTAACLVVYLFFFSPLFNSYEEWKDSAALSSIILDEVSEVSSDLPTGTTIQIEGLPERIASYSSKIPHVYSVRYLNDYAIKSWLDLNHPGNGINIIAGDYSVYKTYPRKVNFDVQPQQDGSVTIILEPVD